ncbi:MAG: hypothetical protein KKD98_07910, partial [Candidatus Thermoplasmatota archaeon]|nr:hypothetical protein [Candidatus Thermoplasmatota archaeon]
VTDHYTTNPNWYWNDAWYQYETLLDYGLDNDHIYFVVSQAVLNSVAHWGESYVDYIIPTQDAGFTSSEIKQVIISAYQDVGTQMNSNDCLYQIWIGHGGFFNGATLDDLGFGIDEYAGNWVKILHTSGEFESSLLDNIPNYAEMILLFQPCHSGGAAMNINKVNTVIISSAKIGNVDEGWITHWRDGFSPAYANADGFVSFYNGQVFGEVYGVLDGELSIYEGYVYAAEKMHIQTNGGQQSFVSDIPDGTQGKFYWYFSSNPPPSGENGHISYSIYFGELRLPY